LLTIGAPIVGPVFTLALAAATHGYAVARQLIIESVKDSQLLWLTMALSASAIYEAVTALEARGAAPVPQFCIALFCVTAFACSIIVMTATTKTCNESLIVQARSKRAPRRVAAPLPRLVPISIWLTTFVAVVFTLMHIRLRYVRVVRSGNYRTFDRPYS
jgi:membrane glycosyltransferase